MSLPHPRLSRSRRHYRAALGRIELLEPRTLMSVTPSVYTVAGLQTDSAVYDLQGNLWVVNYTSTTFPSGLSFDQVDSVNHTIADSIDLGAAGISPFATSFAVGKGAARDSWRARSTVPARGRPPHVRPPPRARSRGAGRAAPVGRQWPVSRAWSMVERSDAGE